MLNTIYENKTEEKFLKVIKEIKIKDYDLIRTKENFFIWKKKKGNHYIRLTLIRTGFYERTFFYWNLETDFKPYSDRQGEQFKSETFKANETDKFYKYFLKMCDRIGSLK
jgi:hypothetical protein